LIAGAATYIVTGLFDTYRNPGSWNAAISAQKSEKIKKLDLVLHGEKSDNPVHVQRRGFATIRALHQFTGANSVTGYLNVFSPGVFIERQINEAYNERLKTRQFTLSVTEEYLSIFSRHDSKDSKKIMHELQALESRVVSEMERWKATFQDPKIQVEDESIIKSAMQEGRLRVSGALAFTTSILGFLLIYVAHELTKPIEAPIGQIQHFDIFEAFKGDRDSLR
jgi:hypothetical protein